MKFGISKNVIFLIIALLLALTNQKLSVNKAKNTLYGFLLDNKNKNIPYYDNMNETKYPAYKPSCDNTTAKNETNITDDFNYTITNTTQPIIIIPEPTPLCNAKWDYTHHGDDWECICTDGKEQSPIDLPPRTKATLSPIRPVMNYEKINSDDDGATIDNVNRVIGGGDADDGIKIRYHNGAIKILHQELGKLIQIDGTMYVAEEIVFHTPSEHTISGDRFDMEMQVIHYGRSKGDIAKQAVVSFLFKSTPGKYNKFIDSLDFYSLPNPTDTFRDLFNDIYIPNVLYSSDDEDIPVLKSYSFYTYEGSLTFPPCTERTTYYVTADPIELSSTAISLFKEALKKPDSLDKDGNLISDPNPPTENYRETQPLNGREVFIYDHRKFDCPSFGKKSKTATPAGHWEKRVTDKTKYIHIDSNQPSGIPGAFVVTDTEVKNRDLDDKDKSPNLYLYLN